MKELSIAAGYEKMSDSLPIAQTDEMFDELIEDDRFKRKLEDYLEQQQRAVEKRKVKSELHLLKRDLYKVPKRNIHIPKEFLEKKSEMEERLPGMQENGPMETSAQKLPMAQVQESLAEENAPGLDSNRAFTDIEKQVFEQTAAAKQMLEQISRAEKTSKGLKKIQERKKKYPHLNDCTVIPYGKRSIRGCGGTGIGIPDAC